ncbi:MAG: ATP-binding cassette domain-containing protein [Propionibacteriaceae bacterium]|nr:ATP-binding cassette domain-containing protein [Propionibacteriaceae bacterium]
MIELEHITKRYGSRRVVDDLNLTIEPGRIYGFLGPNGAGKTTTMNIITGYLAASSGTVKINGLDVLAEPEKAKKLVGYLPEQPPLYMDMKVGEYLRFAAAIKQLPREARATAVAEAMRKARVEDVAGRLIRNLSKGYRQRVGVAQAILGHPEIVILDEPTVGLDPSQIIEMRELIKKLGRTQTVILSSHILSEVTEVCDYIFIIANGRLVANDTTGRLLNAPKSGSRDIEILVKGNGDDAKKVLGRFTSSIKSLRASSAGAGESLVRAKVAGNADRRQEFLKALIDGGCKVVEFRTAHKSLEQTFLELTNQAPRADFDDDETPAPAKKAGSAKVLPEPGATPAEAADRDDEAWAEPADHPGEDEPTRADDVKPADESEPADGSADKGGDK